MTILKKSFWFLLLVIIVLVFVKASNNSTGFPRTTKPIHKIVKLMYMPVSNIENYTCSWIRTMKHQYRMCKNDPGLAEILVKARQLAISQCEEQFRFSRWNCSRPTKLFKQVYRETAVLYSMLSSALVYTVARACTDGKLRRCNCPQEVDSSDEASAMQWGLCSDNVKYGHRFVRRFLQLSNKYDSTREILYHNAEVGVRLVYENVKKTCKCQGLSGSCEMKICWKRMESYEKISASLKKKYHHAVLVKTGNKNGRAVRKDNKRRNLFYMVQSPSFCYLTRGRHCADPANCATICCARGYYTRKISEGDFCNCQWNENSQIKCDNCIVHNQQYFCR